MEKKQSVLGPSHQLLECFSTGKDIFEICLDGARDTDFLADRNAPVLTEKNEFRKNQERIFRFPQSGNPLYCFTN